MKSLAMVVGLFCTLAATAGVRLVLAPPRGSVYVGQTFTVEVIASPTSDTQIGTANYDYTCERVLELPLKWRSGFEPMYVMPTNVYMCEGFDYTIGLPLFDVSNRNDTLTDGDCCYVVTATEECQFYWITQDTCFFKIEYEALQEGVCTIGWDGTSIYPYLYGFYFIEDLPCWQTLSSVWPGQGCTVSITNPMPGDCNFDNEITYADINPFVVAYTAHKKCADMDNNGLYTYTDISLFLRALNG